jgi:creatinine deaminase
MTPVLDAQSMLAVALEQARKSLSEGGIPVGGAIFRTDGTLVGAGHNRLIQHGDPSMHGETDAFRSAGRQQNFREMILVTTLAPYWYCSGLIYQFRFKQVFVGDARNAQGGVAWLREQGFDIVDLDSEECIAMMTAWKEANPKIWDECIGDG